MQKEYIRLNIPNLRRSVGQTHFITAMKIIKETHNLLCNFLLIFDFRFNAKNFNNVQLKNAMHLFRFLKGPVKSKRP